MRQIHLYGIPTPTTEGEIRKYYSVYYNRARTLLTSGHKSGRSPRMAVRIGNLSGTGAMAKRGSSRRMSANMSS
jgi:hypothetical protein